MTGEIHMLRTMLKQREEAERALRKALAETKAGLADRAAELEEVNRRLQAELSDRERVEESLRDRQERLRTAVAAAGMGTWRYDLRTKLTTRGAD